MKLFFIPFFTLILSDATAQQGNVTLLFNGKNLDGWYSFLTTKGEK